MVADLINNTINYSVKNKKYKTKYPNLDINQTYLDQHKAILNNDSDTICSYTDAVKVMSLVDKIKRIKRKIKLI